jgi:hypothetical protein
MNLELKNAHLTPALSPRRAERETVRSVFKVPMRMPMQVEALPTGMQFSRSRAICMCEFGRRPHQIPRCQRIPAPEPAACEMPGEIL